MLGFGSQGQFMLGPSVNSHHSTNVLVSKTVLDSYSMANVFFAADVIGGQSVSPCEKVCRVDGMMATVRDRSMSKRRRSFRTQTCAAVVLCPS